MKKKRALFDIKLNSIQDTDNPTKKEVEFILHDFEVSHNNSIISKETALKTLHTLKDMPIVCKYHPVSEVGADDDALGSHELYLDQDRKSGDTILGLDTVPIGVFTEDGYISTILDENGQEKEVVIGKGILWASRFPNVIGLLKEWNDSGIDVVSSMEILYDSYLFKDGVEEILSYVYEGHCILNSEERGNHQKVYPAYDVSKITKLVAQAVNQENIDKQLNDKEVNKVEKFKKVFELSHSDIRSKLYAKLDATLGENEDSWISDVYETYFIVNLYSWSEENSYDKHFKLNYTKSENDVEIDFDSKVEVFLTRNWEEIVPESVQSQLNEKDQTITELQTQVNSLTETKNDIENKFNSASEKVVELTTKVSELEPFKTQFEAKQNEEKLNEKKEFYSKKFEALKASDTFASDEVQELLNKSIYENEDGKQAILQLNSILVDLVVFEQAKPEESIIREVSSKRENLIPASDDFDSRYSK
ncbi:hypothetical protein [Niallia sp. FSL M8-0099]|uniref:hypothetical protein n=1 Tax=Niallia sp. FSL M8-0099 TaxID=2954519 RepID=UPI0030FA0C3B